MQRGPPTRSRRWRRRGHRRAGSAAAGRGRSPGRWQSGAGPGTRRSPARRRRTESPSAGCRTRGRSREMGCCLRRPLRWCAGSRRSPNDANRHRASREGLFLLLHPRGGLLPPPPAPGRLEPAAQLLPRRDLLFLCLVVARVGVRIVGLEQPAHLVHLVLSRVAQVAKALAQFAAGVITGLGRKQEAHDRPDGDAKQKRPEPRPRAAIAHSPASASSGAATRAARGAAWESRGGFTYLSVAWRVPCTRSCSNKKANVFSRSAPMAARTLSGRSQNRFLKGPIAFLRLL